MMIVEPVIKLALQFVYFAFEFSHLAVIIEYKTLFSTGFERKFFKSKNNGFLQGIFENFRISQKGVPIYAIKGFLAYFARWFLIFLIKIIMLLL